MGLPVLRSLRRHFARGVRINGARIDERYARRYAGQHALTPEVHRFDVRRGRQHGDDQFCLVRGPRRRWGGDSPGGLQHIDVALHDVVDHQGVPGFEQVASHGCAHVAEPDEADLHLRLIVVFTPPEVVLSSNQRDVMVLVWV